jgi:hypothetical protein
MPSLHATKFRDVDDDDRLNFLAFGIAYWALIKFAALAVAGLLQ